MTQTADFKNSNLGSKQVCSEVELCCLLLTNLRHNNCL